MNNHPLDGQVVISTPEAYAEAAMSTACPDDAIDLEGRLHPGVLKTSLERFLFAAQALDHVKKTTVYGKSFPKSMEVGALPAPKPFKVDPQVFHAIVGIATEAGELVQALLKAMYEGKPVDLVNLLEESGDIDWYQALLDSRIDGNQVKRWQSNRDKLARRYAKNKSVGFTKEAAIHRDLSSERAILEQVGAVNITAPVGAEVPTGGLMKIIGESSNVTPPPAILPETPVSASEARHDTESVSESLDAGDKDSDPIIVVSDAHPVGNADVTVSPTPHEKPLKPRGGKK